MQAIIRAASEYRMWGRFAAIRHIQKQTGYNLATARRVLTIALQCEAVQ